MTIDEMWHALKDGRFDGMNSLVGEEVKEAYEMVNLIKKCRTVEQTVPLPFYISDNLTDGANGGVDKQWNVE